MAAPVAVGFGRSRGGRHRRARPGPAASAQLGDRSPGRRPPAVGYACRAGPPPGRWRHDGRRVAPPRNESRTPESRRGDEARASSRATRSRSPSDRFAATTSVTTDATQAAHRRVTGRVDDRGRSRGAHGRVGQRQRCGDQSRTREPAASAGRLASTSARPGRGARPSSRSDRRAAAPTGRARRPSGRGSALRRRPVGGGLGVRLGGDPASHQAGRVLPAADRRDELGALVIGHAERDERLFGAGLERRVVRRDDLLGQRAPRVHLAYVPRSSRSRRARGIPVGIRPAAVSIFGDRDDSAKGPRWWCLPTAPAESDPRPHTDAVTAVSSRHLAAPTWGKRDRAKGPAMASRTYQNFDLLLEAAEAGRSARAGDHEPPRREPVAGSRFRSTRRSWRTCCSSWTPAAPARRAGSDPRDVDDLGGPLFETVFCEDIMLTWRRSQDYAREHGDGLRLRLQPH